MGRKARFSGLVPSVERKARFRAEIRDETGYKEIQIMQQKPVLGIKLLTLFQEEFSIKSPLYFMSSKMS